MPHPRPRLPLPQPQPQTQPRLHRRPLIRMQRAQTTGHAQTARIKAEGMKMRGRQKRKQRANESSFVSSFFSFFYTSFFLSFFLLHKALMLVGFVFGVVSASPLFYFVRLMS